MGFDFTGRVLEAARTSPTNSVGTGEPVTGVVRALQTVPTDYFFSGSKAPEIVEPWADQYRAAVLQAPGITTIEYVVWAANTAQLATLDGWWTEQGTGTIPRGGALEVVDGRVGFGPWLDGTDRVLVADEGNRDIGLIIVVVVARGDVDYDDEGWVDPAIPTLGRKGDQPYLSFVIDLAHQNPAAGIARLDDAQLALLDGGLSLERGDSVMVVRYSIAAPCFWWSRNDRYETRFGWNAKTQKWEPYRGSAPKDLGRLETGATYTLDPRPRGPVLGASLPGNAGAFDSYAMLRLGENPGAGSLPVAPADPDGFQGVQVVTDAEASKDYDFTQQPLLAGVLGRSSGNLQFNPAYLKRHAGERLWYVYGSFQADASGAVGPLLGSDVTPLFIAPVPGPTDYPFIRLGNRRSLLARLVDTEGELESAPLGQGEVLVALSTGRLRLHAADIEKADPGSPAFDKQFLGEVVYFDGIALNQQPQPLRPPAALVSDADGNLYLPQGDAFGLGLSGVLDLPDGTGAVPAHPEIPASLRPGGDDSVTATTGRVRQIDDMLGDLILFSQQGAVRLIHIVGRNDDLPGHEFDVDGGEAYIARQATDLGGSPVSRVLLNSDDHEKFGDDPVYFVQATFTPAVYADRPRLISRNREPFRFAGGEHLRYEIDGAEHDWAFGGDVGRAYTAVEVAALLPGATALNGRVALAGTQHVEIAFGREVIPGDPVAKDFSGAAVLGFLPGWRAGTVPVWLPDSGVALGMYRNALNLDRSKGTADYNAVSRMTDAVIQQPVMPSPFVFLDAPPLQDIAGYDDGIFFQFTSAPAQGTSDTDAVPAVPRLLENFTDLHYRFGERKFEWLAENSVSQAILHPVNALNLMGSSILPESLLGAPGIDGGLWIAPLGEASHFAEQGVEYLLPDGGATGAAVLIERFGRKVTFGSKGQHAADTGVFTDMGADFSAAQPGWRLKVLSGPAVGSYLVVLGGVGHSVTVSPSFLVTADGISWEMHEGIPDTGYDPGLVADKVFKEFSHLPSEPFKVRVLTPVGLVGVSGLQAQVSEALRSGRQVGLRFEFAAPSDDNSSSLVPLAQTKLGVLANGALTLPPMSAARWTAAAFAVKIGATQFPILGVTAFSEDPAGVEYLTQATAQDPRGRLKFSKALLAAYSSALVQYVETFLPPAALAARASEFDPLTGSLNLSQDILTTWAGHEVYFVEQMVTEDKQDVSIAPLSGTFSFLEPIKPNQIVEVEYWAATDDGHRTGDMIHEFLSVFIRNENTVRQSATEYRFNLAGRVIDERVQPVVYIGPMQQNFGADDDYQQDYLPGEGDSKIGRIMFYRPMADYVQPTVTYAAFNAVGGERVYESSTKPVYRPPFFIEADTDRIGLRGDRTGDILPGQLLRLGAQCLYIKKTQYYPPHTEMVPDDNGFLVPVQKGDVTAVTFFPKTVVEAGSRAPGNDLVNVITEDRVALVVDVDGADPVTVTEATAGFWATLDLTQHPFEPVAKGQSSITFLGDFTALAVPGYLLEASGAPYTIAQADLSKDGTRTKVSLTSPLYRSLSVHDQPTMRLSCRAVYPPDSREFLGVGPIYDTEPVELVLYGEQDSEGRLLPGRTLTPGVECAVESDTGRVKLLDPNQAALVAGQHLALAFTRLKVLSPFLKDGIVQYPRYVAGYKYVTTPSTTNGLKDGLLQGTYSFSNPDTYYWRLVPVASFLGEIAQQAQQEISAKQPAGGAVRAQPSGNENWKQGRVGLKAERRHLTDTDMAARRFLSFYATVVNTFEQVPETISGGFVGDRDGKFRFFVGHGLDYAPPGYEDPITGALNPRDVWAVACRSLETGNDTTILAEDPLVVPYTMQLNDGVIEGACPDADFLHRMIKAQTRLVHNDVDDVALLRVGRVERSLGGFIWFKTKMWGAFDRLAEPSALSRIFPRRTRAFFTTYPGLNADETTGDPGVYAWRRYTWAWDWDSGLSLTTGSTTRTTIGKLGNPVLGDITNVRDGALTKRCARGRVWGYFPLGLPRGAFFKDDGSPSDPIVEPCIIVTPAMLRDFPVNPETGYPDQSLLLSQGGGIPDAAAGDPELAVPGFKQGDQLAWGKPTGRTYAAYYCAPLSVGGQNTLPGLFVRDVSFGCVLRFQTDEGDAITDPEKVLVGTGQDSGYPAHSDNAPLAPITWGDTLYVGPPVGTSKAPNDPPTTEELAQAAGAADAYRTGFDLRLNEDGTVDDLSLPSIHDPFFLPIKEWLGQHSPDPMSCMEGEIEFVYDKQNPLGIPALSGEERDDSGDYGIPYLATGNTELDRLGAAQVAAPQVMEAVTTATGLSAYPDEIRGADGEVAGALSPWIGGCYKEPATLLTRSDLAPVGLGLGPLRLYDLLFIEVNAGAAYPAGMQGILSVGRSVTLADGSGGTCNYIEPPRFVTQTTPPAGPGNATGSPVRYTFDNAVAYVNDPAPLPFPVGLPPFPVDPPGVRLRFDPAGLGLSILDFVDVDPFVLNDGATAPGGIGNFNDLWSPNPADPRYNNKITITLFARQDQGITTPPSPGPLPTAGQPVLTITLYQGTIQTEDYLGNLYPVAAPVALTVFGIKQVVGPEPVDQRREVHQVGGTSLFPFSGGTALQQREWFLPHETVGGVISSLYGYEFTISVDTFAPDPAAGPFGESGTAYIDPDRLTFHEVIDLRHVKHRAYTHPVSGVPLGGALVVHEVTAVKDGAQCPSRVNRMVNGWTGGTPNPLTFLARSNTLTSLGDYFPGDCGGVWANALPGVSPESGTIRVMAWEGYNNTPLLLADVPFAVAPSVSEPPAVPGGFPWPAIFAGTGVTEGPVGSGALGPYNNVITDITPSVLGMETLVEPGDIVVVTASADPLNLATTKAGTYIVRHAVEPDRGAFIPTNLWKAVAPRTPAGAGSGWTAFTFPVSQGGANGPTPDLRVADSTPSAAQMFPPSGRVFVVRDVTTLAGPTGDPLAVVSAAYDSIGPVTDGQVSFIHLTDFRDAQGLALSVTDFEAAVNAGKYPVSGMTTLPVQMTAPGLPGSNCVGYDDGLAGNYCYGFNALTFTSVVSGSTPLLLTAPADIVRGAPAAGQAGVSAQSVNGPSGPDYTFVPDPTFAVYENVPGTLDLSAITAAQWAALNTALAGWTGLSCLLPGTTLALEGAASAPGFYAQAGIFLEPSVPHAVFDLNGVRAHVVDHHDDGTEHDLPITEVGMRDFTAYQRPGDPVPTTPEGVSFEVRRIRRFHDKQDGLDNNLAPLRFAYEMRRGEITGFTRQNVSGADKQGGVIDALGFHWDDGKQYTGTTLGTFTSPDVNIHPGDRLRVLDSNGDLFEEAEIAGFVPLSPTDRHPGKLRLAVPGLHRKADAADYIGMRFEVWLRHAPVPHEQTCAQLLDLITFKAVTRTDADRTDPDPTNWKGGYVPDLLPGDTYEGVANNLYDDLSPQPFTARGVQKGDIVLVDPAGLLPTGETGVYPIGDAGVAPRSPSWPGAYVPGAPDPVDDNRGFYRVTKIVEDPGQPSHLVVSGESSFAGRLGLDTVFPKNATAQETFGYTVYPTIHDSALNPDLIEGQADLRPTKLPDPVYGYTANQHYSIRPFSYRVIRPSRLFSTKAVDLALTMRERMLSLIQMFRVALLGQKHGSYFVFQRDHHAHELERPNDPETGLGVLSNPFIERLVGQMMVMPFCNNGACLSILDRRFWVLDNRLDYLTGKDEVSCRRIGPAETGTAQGSTPGTITLDPGATGDYAAWAIEITGGIGAGQTRRITAYDPGTKVAQVVPDWDTLPDGTSTYTVRQVPYTALTDTAGGGKVRPLLPDRVQTILNTVDRFRALRSTWLAYRVHRVLGTLAAIKNFDAMLPERLAEAERALLIGDSTGDSNA